MMFLALGVPVYVVFAALLLFAAGMVVMRTFSLVRHAKSLAAQAKETSERLNEAAADIEAQVQQASERAASLQKAQPGRGSARRRRV
ncbi:MAG: hypothetical protein ACXVD2_07790 [Actinomycetota bacterium]